MAEEKLVSSGVAAKHLGITPRALQNWVDREIVTPSRFLPSGHMRWLISELDEQVERLVERRRKKK